MKLAVVMLASLYTDSSKKQISSQFSARLTYCRPVARGGAVGADPPPSQIKGPLFK